MAWRTGDKVRPGHGPRRVGVIIAANGKTRVLWSDTKELGWPDHVIADSGPDVIPAGDGRIKTCIECSMPFHPGDDFRELMCPNCDDRPASGPLPAWVAEWWEAIGNAKYPVLKYPGRNPPE